MKEHVRIKIQCPKCRSEEVNVIDAVYKYGMIKCKKCGHKWIVEVSVLDAAYEYGMIKCKECGHKWIVEVQRGKEKEVSKEMTKYVTIPELAKLLGKHRFSIYLKVCKGEIKSERAGRMYLIPRSEVERLTKQG